MRGGLLSLVDYSADGAVAQITLNRPPVNALNAALIADIASALQRAAAPDIRAVVLTGNKHFAAGADIKRFVEAFDTDTVEPQASGLGDVVLSVEGLPKPVIAVVNGFALGGGLELAMGADFRYFGETALVGQPEVKLGLIPGAGGTQRLQRLVGYQMAKDIIMSGRQVPADEALAIGLADKVVADSDVLSLALQDASTWAQGPTLAYAAAKRALTEARALPFEAALEFERDRFNELFSTVDARSGILAFVEREQPHFEGR